MTWLIAISTLMIIVGMCYLILLKRTSSGESLAISLPPPIILRDRFLILSADELIQELGLQKSINKIQMDLGMSRENWESDALPFLRNYIEFVQRLPASESHHHAGDGGLVRHTLDVAQYSLVAANSRSWPPYSKTEDIPKLTTVWKYGIMCAAILHDVGKTLTSFHVELYENGTDAEKIYWVPDAGPMRQTGRQYYRVEFPTLKTAYRVHAEIAWTFFQALVPTDVRQWIAISDPSLIHALRTFLTGQKDDGPLSQLITDADRQSTARDLMHGTRQRFATAKITPLIEVLMETLKTIMRTERSAFFSTAVRAGGDMFRKGDIVYIMAKHVPDNVRKYLSQKNSKFAPSFPKANERIFDTLLEYGAIIPDADNPHKAILNIDVSFEKDSGEIGEHNFSVLAFKIDSLFEEGEYPAEFEGILVLQKRRKETLPKKQEPRSQPQSQETLQTLVLGPSLETDAEAPGNFNQEPTFVENPAPQKSALPTDAISALDSLLSSVIPADDPELNLATGGAPEVYSESAPTEDNKPHHNSPQTKQEKAKVTPQKTDVKINLSSLAKLTKTSKNIPPTTEKKPVSRESIQQDASPNIMSLPAIEQAQSGLTQQTMNNHQLSIDSPRPGTVSAAETSLGEMLTMGDSVLVNEDITEIASLADYLNLTTVQSEVKAETSIQSIRNNLLEDGKKFLNYLVDGLSSGSISVNESGARIHFINEGMLMITPAIFRDYAGSFNKNDPSCPGLRAQKGFEQIKLHARTRKTALFQVIKKDEPQTRLFQTYLIKEENIKLLIQPSSRPQNNTTIALLHPLTITKSETKNEQQNT